MIFFHRPNPQHLTEAFMKQREKSYLFLVCILTVVWITPAAHATRVRPMSLDEVRDTAVAIVVADVTGVSTRVAPEGRMVWTDYQLRVVETLKGTDQPQRELSFAGGKAGDLDVGFGDSPTLELGKRYLFFVAPGSNHPTPVVGWAQGLFRVEQALVGNEKREVLISWDGDLLEIAPNGKLARGPLVDVLDGRIVPARVAHPPERTYLRVDEPVVRDSNGRPIPQQSSSIRPTALVVPLRHATMADIRDFAGKTLDADDAALVPKNR
jgi:hypothetical protein